MLGSRRDHVSTQVESTVASRRDRRIAAILGFLWPGVGYLYAGRGVLGLLLLLLFPVAGLSCLLVGAATSVGAWRGACRICIPDG